MPLLLRAASRAAVGPLRQRAMFAIAPLSRTFAAEAKAETTTDSPFGNESEATAQQIDTPWQKWFPYDPKPTIPQYAPYVVQLEQGKEYLWCSCGRAKTQPWCDQKSCGTEFKPMHYVPRTTGYKALCGCKHSHSKPLADFTGFWMWCDHNILQGCTFMFSFCFVSSVFLSYFFHP